MRSGFASFLVLALTLAACAGFPAQTPAPDSIATQVAATMSAFTYAARSATEVSPTETPAEPEAPEPSMAAPEPSRPPIVRVAYTSGGNVWLVEGDAPPVQLTSSGYAETVRISSDGARVVFTRRPTSNGPAEIRAVSRDGSGETVLVPGNTWTDLHPNPSLAYNDVNLVSFIPGTHRLLLNTRGIPIGPGSLKYDDLLMLDADTAALTTLLPAGSAGDPLISPDGQKVALTDSDSISLITVDGEILRADAITFTPVITYSEYEYYPKGQWAPDSSAVGFAIPSRDPLASDASAALWRLPADGTPPVNLAFIPGDFFFTQFDAPSFSPDLAWVAFQRETATPGIRHLILSRADGTSESIIATGRTFWDGWSPDSTHFAFGQDEPVNLHAGSLGAASSPVATGIELRWANETTVVYLSGSTGAWTLMRQSLGSPAVALASAVGEFTAFDLVYR